MIYKSKYKFIFKITFAISIINLIIGIGCNKNSNPVTNNNQTEIDSLIFSKDSISRYTTLNSIDTVYTDTTIKKLKFQYDLMTNDVLADSLVSSGFFISGIPSVAYQTFGKYNNGTVNYNWNADSSVNYLHIGFEVYYTDSIPENVKMFNIRIYRVY
jgi:hypothetical protein